MRRVPPNALSSRNGRACMVDSGESEVALRCESQGLDIQLTYV